MGKWKRYMLKKIMKHVEYLEEQLKYYKQRYKALAESMDLEDYLLFVQESGYVGKSFSQVRKNQKSYKGAEP